MGDMSNGGPGYGGYGGRPELNPRYGSGEFEPQRRPEWNPYGRGPQQPRQMEPPMPWNPMGRMQDLPGQFESPGWGGWGGKQGGPPGMYGPQPQPFSPLAGEGYRQANGQLATPPQPGATSTFQWGNGPRYAVPPPGANPSAGMGPGAYGPNGPLDPRDTSIGEGMYGSPVRMPGGGLYYAGAPGGSGMQGGGSGAYGPQAPRSADSVMGQPPPAPGGYQPGSFSAGVAALNRNDPNARNMLGAAAGLPPQTGTYSSQGPAPRGGASSQEEMMRQAAFQYLSQGQNPYPPSQPQFTPNQQLMMQSGRGQRGFWQGPTSPFGMQGPYNPYGRYGSADSPQRPGNYNPYGGGGGMQNGAPK